MACRASCPSRSAQAGHTRSTTSLRSTGSAPPSLPQSRHRAGAGALAVWTAQQALDLARHRLGAGPLEEHHGMPVDDEPVLDLDPRGLDALGCHLGGPPDRLAHGGIARGVAVPDDLDDAVAVAVAAAG